MAILNAGDVFEMEAKYLKPGMHMIRNDREIELWEVEYNPGQDYATIDICFHYVEDEDGEEDNQAWCNFCFPDEMVKVIYIPGLPYPLHAINV